MIEKYDMNVEPTIKRLQNWVQSVHYSMPKAGEEVANMVLRFSIPVTPKRTGELRRTVRKEYISTTDHLTTRIVYYAVNPRDGFVYAYIQEVNPGGRYHYPESYTTPGTHDRYLMTGIEKAMPMIERIIERIYRGE